MSRGFSLIETIIYIALLALLMSGAIVTVYQITQSSYLVGEKNVVQEEGHFVLRKIEEAFSGAQDVSTSGSGCGGVLSVTQYDGDVLTFSRDNSTDMIMLDRNGAGGNELTTENVQANCLSFINLGGPPKGVETTLTIGEVDFALTKYVR